MIAAPIAPLLSVCVEHLLGMNISNMLD